ncbi:YcjX family GTP-binding protein [Marinobacterium weihaiense]|uniref:YcjX family protein n=1 Tax=Marinobacterium weihaiense TaxID=2851016 RepID=A0ABS6MAK6_9GAMM|nr:YcjX family protein [Marinobacterium weihaiense]MBV0932929.1 YcjX family protein [Marinobacterium weihaiense]
MSLNKELHRLARKSRLDSLSHHLKTRVEQGLEQRIKLAITGLSRSGKTVFISSFAHHLLQSDLGTSLPFFAASADGRIIAARDLSTGSIQPFPLAKTLDGLRTYPPHWPDSTETLSEICLALRYRRSPGLGRVLGEHATLYIDLIDYPGEWLLDLPLLELTFEQWCQQQRQLFAQAPRASAAQAWLARQHDIDWLAPATDAELAQLSETFRTLLQQLREPPHSLSLLQPGRLLMPGELAGSDLLNLFPILTAFPENPAEAADDSLLVRLQQAYDRYCQDVVRPFYQDHFRHFDRQIVLVDCLKTLNRGRACFNDMQLALNTLLQSFNYGRSGLLRRLFSPRISRVLFAATKADHVTANQHHNLDRFLQLMVESAQRDIRFEHVDTRCLALASVRATQAAEARLDGQHLSCLRGMRKDTGEEIALFPGEVPVELPGDADWNSERFRFVDFAPRPLPAGPLRPEHHIRLDQAADHLLGDLFR